MSERDIKRWQDTITPRDKAPHPWTIGSGGSWDMMEVQPIPDAMLAELAQRYQYAGTPWNCRSMPLSESDREYMYMLYYGMQGLVARLRLAEKERDFAKTEIARLHDDIRELTDVRVLDEEDRDRRVAARHLSKARAERALRAELDALKAWKEEVERQEPVGEIQRANSTGNYICSEVWVPLPVGSKLYALPGAQPAPSVPEGFSREDLEAVADGLDGYEKTVNVGNVTGEGDDHLESTTAYAARFIRTMLAAAPEAKL